MLLKKMIKKMLISSNLFSRIRREVSSCALPLDLEVPVPSGNHKNLCHSLADQLIQRGLFSSAQIVIQRMISHSMSVADAISVANSVVDRGLDLDLDSYAVLIRKLVTLGETQLAESLYLIKIESQGNNTDPSVLNSLVICSCELGRIEDAVNYFNRLLSFKYVPHKEACLTILQQFCAQEQYLDAFDLFLRAHYAEAELSFGCYNLLINGLCHKGHLDEALHVFDMLLNHKHLPTVHICKSLFYALCKGRRGVDAVLLIGEMESRGMYVDRAMYTSLVLMYCRDRKMEMAMQVFFRMLMIGYQPDQYLCNILIDGFMKLSLYDKVWVLHNKMMEWGIKPDVVTYQVLISQYCKEGKIDCALTLLQDMIYSKVAPNVHCYTVLFSSLYKHNKTEEFFVLYKNMVESGVIPDHVLYLKLMKMLPVCKSQQLAFTILQALAKNGCGIDPALPASSVQNTDYDFEQEIELLLERIVCKNINLATEAYSIYISSLCEKGEVDKALVYLKKMDDARCRPLTFCYNSLIKCLSQMGHFEDANSVIDLMEDRGLIIDQSTFLIVINELCKQGNMVSAIDFLDQMEKRSMKPSVAIYGSIIGCLVKEGNFFDAEEIFNRMLLCGVDPDEGVYSTMICGYSMSGRVLIAQELFDKMTENSIKPSYRCYTTFISGLVKAHMIDEACKYLDKMLDDGMVPNAVLYTSLILHFLKNREFGVALKLVNIVGKNDISWDLTMCMAFVNGVRRYICRNNNKSYNSSRESERGIEKLLYLLNWSPFPDMENCLRDLTTSDALKWLARKLIKGFRGAAIKDNLYLNNCVISWLCREEMINDAYSHLQLMQREGVYPNHVTYTILLSGHIHLNDVDRAVRLFNKMNVDGCVPDRITYDTLLKGFIRAGRLTDAMSLLHSMRKRGLCPKRTSYEMLLYCFCRSGPSVSGSRIFQEMIAEYYQRILNDHCQSPYNLCESSRLHEDQLIYVNMYRRAMYMGKKLFLSCHSSFPYCQK